MVKTDINFYARYEQQKKRGRKAKNKNLWLILPLLLVAGLMAGLAADILMQNAAKNARLKSLDASIAGMQEDYDDVSLLSYRASALGNEYAALQSSEVLMSLYPALSRQLFYTVKDCAGEAFTLDKFSYDEANLTLIVDAHAPSVNEMPRFVEALRATGLFSEVYYIGYTSDSDGDYYCQAGCTLNSILGGLS